nr:hypothetical protein Iba_chr12eCG2910 [Ipomoea batatas]
MAEQRPQSYRSTMVWVHVGQCVGSADRSEKIYEVWPMGASKCQPFGDGPDWTLQETQEKSNISTKTYPEDEKTLPFFQALISHRQAIRHIHKKT